MASLARLGDFDIYETASSLIGKLQEKDSKSGKFLRRDKMRELSRFRRLDKFLMYFVETKHPTTGPVRVQPSDIQSSDISYISFVSFSRLSLERVLSIYPLN